MNFFEKLLSGTLPFTFLMLVGIYLSFKNRFPQITRFKESLALTVSSFKNGRNAKEFTSLKAASTSLSATVGTGNIAGVAGALSIGGAGAVFWMWVSALLGMIIKSAEITLAVLYREKSESGFVGGPMYYIKNGLGKKFKVLSIAFAIATLPAVFSSGNMAQTNSAIITFCNNNWSQSCFGILFALICYFSISSTLTKIASITEKLVPLMSIIYIFLCGIVIFKNIDAVPIAFRSIFVGAFSPKAVTGGAAGSLAACIFSGASRGIFSNEAGLGTSGMAHSVAVDANPKIQGLYGIFEVFLDTLLLCTLTALTILCSGVKINYGTMASTELVGQALKVTFGNFSSFALSLMMCLFAVSSIIGWSIYGKLSCRYLFGEKADYLFNIIYPAACILGATLKGESIWQVAGISNGIMLCINLIAVILLSDKVNSYLKREKKSGKQKNWCHSQNIKPKRGGYNHF